MLEMRKVVAVWRWARVVAPLALLLPVILACPTRPLEVARPVCVDQVPFYLALAPEKDVDILFVLDNSNSMEAEQKNLAENFPKLIDALRTEKLGGALPNVHIGVVSSDLGAGNYSLPSCEVQGGDGGRLLSKPRRPGCTPPRDPWISYVDGVTNIPSATADPVQQVKEAFQCIAEIGLGGCGFEHQLESARRALDPALNLNPGFLRKDALLAVVFITDEDDCSAAKAQLFDPAHQSLSDPLGPLTSFRCTEFGIECDRNGRQIGVRNNCRPGFDWLQKADGYAKFFNSLKPGRTMLFAIAGPTDKVDVGLSGSNPELRPTCQSINGSAVPAVRIKYVVDSMDKDGQFNPGGVNICSSDFGPALQLIAEKINTKISACLPAVPMTEQGGIGCSAGDVLAPGVTCATGCLDQVDCAVQEVVGLGGGGESRTQIPKCPADRFAPAVTSCGDTCPCWRFVRSEQCNPAQVGSPYRFEVLRAGGKEAPRGAMGAVYCAAVIPKWGNPALAELPQCVASSGGSSEASCGAAGL